MDNKSGEPEESGAPSAPSRGKTGDFVAGLVIFLIAAYALYESINMPFYGDSGVWGSPGLTPGLISSVLLLLSVMLMIRSGGVSTSGYSFKIGIEGWRGLLTFGIIVVYVAAMPLVGYAPATFVMLFVFQIIFAQQRNWRFLIIWGFGLSAFLTVVLYYIFADFFLIPLP